MSSLWKLITPRDGSTYLRALASPAECRAVASRVPGAKADIAGNVEGALHALLTCLEVSGEKVDWEGERDFGYAGLMGVSAENWESRAGLPVYQRDGSDFIRRRRERGVLCLDDVGVGKTVQTIAALALDTEHVHVVLCPASLRTQWAEEIKRWTKALMDEEQAVHVVFPAGDKRSRIPPPENLQWVVAFYLDSDRVAEVVRRYPYDLVIDEVHNFKRLKSQRQTAIRKLASFAGGRVGLTASPLHNDVERFYPVLDLISPWAWGARNDFLVRYASGKDTGYGVEAGKLSHVEELRNRLSLVSFRRTREDLGTQLPFSTRYSMVWIEAPPRASLVERLRADAHGDGVSHLEWVAVNYKVAPVVEAVTSDLDAGRGALVLTYLRAHAQALHKALPGSLLCMGGTGDNGARAREYLGSCASRGVTPCIVGTLAAIGEGGNLQALKSVNIAAVSHTPEEMRQAVGRVARHGQTGEVPVRIFGCRGTLDERFCAIALDKLAEQAKLDGRKEKSKADLKETLSPSMNKDRARELLERLMKEERQ